MKLSIIAALLAIHVIVSSASADGQLNSTISYELSKEKNLEGDGAKLVVHIKRGNKKYAVNCRSFCLRKKDWTYLINCNFPLFRDICVACRIKLRCGKSDKIFR